MIRLVTVLASVLVLAAPAASASGAAIESPRLSYAVSVRLSAGATTNPLVDAGLCLAGADGSQGSRLTAPKLDGSPAWSPDGRKLAFSRDDTIFVQDERGHSRMIASPGNHNQHPDWSPDGRQIVFDAGAYASAIYSVRPGRSYLRALTHPDIFVFDANPAWSPTGEAIAFGESGPGALTDLFLIDPSGGNRRLLTENGCCPSWSPDGSSVVFERGRDLVIIGADGRGEHILTSTPELETNPAWSPDGGWIAFETRPSTGGYEDVHIAVIRPDGSGFHVLRGSSFPELNPAWRPRAGRRPGPQRACVIRASSRGGVLRGTSEGDLILGGDGRDSIFTGGGDDLVDGGSGADRLVGGQGNDLLFGGFGRDRLVGGPGNDLLFSADGERDVVIGNGGRDWGFVDSVDRVLSVENVRQGSP